MNMNMNNRIARQRFRSATDINNYNNFLLELDSKKNDINPEYKDLSNLYINQTNKQSEIVDPNMYVSFDPKKVAFIYEKRKQIQDLIDLKRDKEKEANYLKKEEEEKGRMENRRKVNIQFEINNIGDLLKMIDQYPDDKDVEYNINMSSLHKIKDPLLELDAMIGLQNLKENIVDQILFYIQNLHIVSAFNEDKKVCSNDFMHTVIYGPPGTGKTEVAKIIGSIFAKLGILSKGTFKKVTRSDLVAGFLGQTAIKTRDVIKE